jgi:hypothetical protein
MYMALPVVILRNEKGTTFLGGRVRTLLGAVPFKLDLSKDANKGLPGVYIGGILMPTPLKSPVGTKERQVRS